MSLLIEPFDFSPFSLQISVSTKACMACISFYGLDTTLVDEKFFWRFLGTTHGVPNLGKTVCNFDIEY